jgi:hypothetical protein
LLFALVTPTTAVGQQTDTVCRFSSELLQPGETICLNGFTNQCQANGAWAVQHDRPCTSDLLPSARSCRISISESAAPGARNCTNRQLRECTEGGHWVPIGRCG